MFRGIILTHDVNLRQELEGFLSANSGVVVVRSMDGYPGRDEFLNIVRAHSPQVAFFDPASLYEAAEASESLEQALAGVAPVVVHWNSDEELLLQLMQTGVREFLRVPVAEKSFLQCLLRLRDSVRLLAPARESSDLLYAFLPAKGGDGASTVAANAALALARIRELRVLLADLDLNGCMTRFMLKVSNPHNMREVIERAADLDEAVWSEVVSIHDGLHVLSAGGINALPPTGFEATRVRRLLEFFRTHYTVTCVDLSSGMEDFALEALTSARRIYLVATPSLPSIFHAREKLRFLESHDLSGRVSLLLNRWHKQAPLKLAEIEEVLGIPVDQSLPDDPPRLHSAMMSGACVDPYSELGREFSRLARLMGEGKTATVDAPRKRGIEHFAIVPKSYQLFR